MVQAFRAQRAALRTMAPETLLIQMYSLKVALAFGLGAVILIGGDERFSEPSLRGPRNLVRWIDVNPRLLWGALFIILGVALVWAVGKTTAVHVLRFGLVVYTFLAITFLYSVIQISTASLVWVVVFAVFAGAHALLSVHLRAYGWR